MPDKNEEEITSGRCQPDNAAGAAPGEVYGLSEPDTGDEAAPAGARAAPTGEPSVDAMIARLDGLDGLPLAEQVAVFEDTHAGLRQVLSELDATPDEAAGQPGAGRR
jgi:hypothetical protein